MPHILLLFCCFCSLPSLFSQEGSYPTPKNYDYIYKDNIKSVRFYQFDSERDYPILSLNSPGHFVLTFDDMEAYAKDFSYKIIHCDANWNPSDQLDALDYIDGYQENRIFEAKNSFSTKVPYTHYEVRLPNEDVKWTKSGNYLLKVFENDNEEDLIITRRFMIVETKMKVVPELRRSAIPPYSSSHQELSCKVQHNGMRIGNPASQVKVVILQNGRWDQKITDLTPTYIQSEEIGFDQQGQILFPGYKEFRPLDLRSFRFRTTQVERLEEYSDGFEMWLFEDRLRIGTTHLFTHDLNGNFLIETHDQRQELQEEYAKINFSLKALSPFEGDVYVLGGFNNFRAQESFKMNYNENCRCYQLHTLLKNGFYDYMYAVQDKETGQLNYEKIEGSSFESENDYLFLVYYKTFGGLYDQLVAIQKFNTRPN